MKTNPVKRLSLSTAYHITNSRTWQDLLLETKNLGFYSLELNVEVPEQYLKKALKSVEKNEISVSSLHNYCPRLSDLPLGRSIYSGYILNSGSEHERKLAVENTKKTIEWAARLGAKAVVMHLGEVQTESAGRNFFKYVKNFGSKGMLYKDHWDALVRERLERMCVSLERLMKSLDEVLPFAADRKIMLGMENRFYYHEVPNIAEIGLLFDKYPDSPLGYWHDTGHAEIFVRQGWVKSHLDYLTPFKDKIIGMHLHDLRSLRDHYAPGSGDFDFKKIAPFDTDNVLLVVEAHTQATPSEVRNSSQYLKQCGFLV